MNLHAHGILSALASLYHWFLFLVLKCESRKLLLRATEHELAMLETKGDGSMLSNNTSVMPI